MSRTKYLLVSFTDYDVAVSREVYEDMQQRDKSIVAVRPVTQAEIKKNNIHVYQASDYIRHVAYEDFKKRVEGKRLKGTVAWFNRLSGQGSIHVEGEGLWPIFACNIAGKKTWYPETACVYLNEGDEVEVEIRPFFSGSLLVCHTPGIVDEDKWNSLDQSQLAFKCNDKGEAINGLFG